MDETPVLVEKRAGYRVVTLNRPQRLNSFNEAMHRALMAALEDAEADSSCRALLLTGAGRGFCAGQDLSDRVASGDTRPDLGAHHRDVLQSAGAETARAAVSGCCCRQRRCRRRRRQHRARLRHRAGGARRQFPAGLCQDRPGAGFRRHLVPAAPRRRRARPRAGAAGRAAAGGKGGSLGPDLEGGRRRQADGRGGEARAALRHRADLRPRPDQARARRRRDQRSRRPARPRARPAARSAAPRPTTPRA